MRQSILFIVLLLGFLAGIVLSSLFENHVALFFTIGAFAVALIMFFPGYAFALVCLFVGISLGWLRYVSAQPAIGPEHVAYYNGGRAAIEGEVVREVEQRVDRQKVTLRVRKIKVAGRWRKAKGKLLLTTGLYPAFRYGDVWRFKGELRKPAIFSYQDEKGYDRNFAYDKYLSRFGIYSLIYYPEEMEKVDKSGGSVVIRSLFDFKEKLIQTTNSLLPEPQSSFLGGLLWGGKRSIDPVLMKNFNRTGTTHIVALSGYNITIIGVIIFLIAPWLSLTRKKAFWLALLVIVFFVLITGAQASVTRAALMGVLVLFAYYIGRPHYSFNLLVLAAAIMAAFNPFVVLFDIGFQLSFLATIGLLYVYPLIEKYAQWLPGRFGVREASLATMSAIFMTLPLIVYQFGRLSLVAPIANILILFAIPPTMFIGFVLLFLSWVFLPVATVLNFLVWAPLTYIIVVVGTLARMPYAHYYVSVTHPAYAAAGYGAIVALLLWRYREGMLASLSYIKTSSF